MLGTPTAETAATTDEAPSLGPTDRIALAYAFALAAVAVGSRAQATALLLSIAALAAGAVAIARLEIVSRAGRVVHDFAAVAYIPVLFLLSGLLISEANPLRWDAPLAELDRAWFGGLREAWVGLLGRPEWLTETASILYASYYPIPIAIAVALYRGDRRADFEWFVFAVVATFLASYLGYFLAPAVGPIAPAAHEPAIRGDAMSAWLGNFLRLFERSHIDAFPSGHTALALVYLVLGWRLLPRWRLALAVLCAGIVFSTVYLSLHYVVD